MGKSVGTNVDVPAAEIKNSVKGIMHYKRKKVLFVTVKKANALKSIANAMRMESGAGKVATARTVRICENHL